jgi:hypothetical protein
LAEDILKEQTENSSESIEESLKRDDVEVEDPALKLGLVFNNIEEPNG